MGQASSTFVSHPEASVDIPGKGKLVGRVAQDKTTHQLKSQRFAGIPYAQPPVGSLRWKRPQPLPTTFRYDNDGKQYDNFAAQCPQATNYALTNGITFGDGPLWPQSEDCLYLNIWCPTQSDGSRVARKLPVLFFIHGGWLQIGNAHYAPDGDPSDLLHTAGLDAVLVTTGYRINAFGFFAHDELRKEDPDNLTGNYGFWDQRAALEWVHQNIELFGGDPDNITVSGLSAGAHSTHSQLMHEFDLSTRDPAYRPIIRRVFLQSNSAIWPSKTVQETRGQLDELCALLNVPASLSDEAKIARLREVDDMTLVKVLAKMNMHTFRATRDTQKAAFVKPDWTKAMMDGRFAQWCQQQRIQFVIGECADEEWVYRYINTPKDKEGLVRQVNNYYTLPLVEKMLPYYGVPMPEKQHHENGTSTPTAVVEGETLYQTLGVNPTATAAEIRTAYLGKVRQHHPDKLQQHQNDANSIADSSQSDVLIRQLNHAYKTLIDDQQRLQYDEVLSASRASLVSSQSNKPRISATVDFESFSPLEQEEEDSPLMFRYPCRCGSAYVIAEEQVHDQVEVVSCDGCSENIRVRYDDEEQPCHQASASSNDKTSDQIGEIFGEICSDSQVYIAERMLVSDLLNGGVDPDRVLRYRINYRAKLIDKVLPQYRGVSHSFDDSIWWFSGLQPGREEESVKEWLKPWIRFIRGEKNVAAEWYAGQEQQVDGRLIRVFDKDASIRVEKDQRWVEKELLIEGMVRVRRELADSFL
ncbi:related to Acetylcholinesterase precursor [Ustilago trichophora]|uniref:Diphthamide biosynthesis protein 4 n=1 Tax=Ustilago trichophora TaxID=86804 RepID=A0A5C3DV41_9BASI|nr:related to Acetylcholinesterase precursor [Ustilago trichophora]